MGFAANLFKMSALFTLLPSSEFSPGEVCLAVPAAVPAARARAQRRAQHRGAGHTCIIHGTCTAAPRVSFKTISLTWSGSRLGLQVV